MAQPLMRAARSLTLAAAILACHAGPSGPAAPSPATMSAEVEVGRSHARLSIPLGRAATGPWRWHEPETRGYYLEFEWAVRIEGDEGAYHLTHYPLSGHIEGDVFVFEISDSAATQAVFGGHPQTGAVLRYLNGKPTPPLGARISYACGARVGA